MLVGEMVQPPGGVRVGCRAETIVEVGCGVQDLLDRGEDAVVPCGQLGERVGRILGGGRLAEVFGEVGDRGPQRGIAGRTAACVEVLVAADGAQARDGLGGELVLGVRGQAGGARW